MTGWSDGTTNVTYSYDYRSRRVYRATSTETNLCIFAGGLSVQEYNVSWIGEAPGVEKLSVEYLRGPDLGGGVGGMVYSIKRPAPGSNYLLACQPSR